MFFGLVLMVWNIRALFLRFKMLKKKLQCTLLKLQVTSVDCRKTWIIMCLLLISLERSIMFTDWPLLSATNTCNVCLIRTGHLRAPLTASTCLYRCVGRFS